MILILAWTRRARLMAALMALAGLGPLACERSSSEQAMVESELRAAQPLARGLIHGHSPLQIALSESNDSQEESELRPVHSPSLTLGGCIGWFIQVDAAQGRAWAVLMAPDQDQLRQCATLAHVSHQRFEDKPLSEQGPAQTQHYQVARLPEGQPAVYQWRQVTDEAHALTWTVARLEDEALTRYPPLAVKPLQGFDPEQAKLELLRVK